ncbi:MAG: HU family DNA-binding protein [Verrucomicrobiales bacterium]|nr:HU family DNA-binding protein [Verrucomicrobiales bacterium]
MATVTKRDLVMRISDKVGLSQREVLEAIEQLMLEITESLSEGDEVVFRNFGTFQTAINKPKVGRNPKRPEIEIEIPARRVVRFRTGKNLKMRVEEKHELGKSR